MLKGVFLDGAEIKGAANKGGQSTKMFSVKAGFEE